MPHHMHIDLNINGKVIRIWVDNMDGPSNSTLRLNASDIADIGLDNVRQVLQWYCNHETEIDSIMLCEECNIPSISSTQFIDHQDLITVINSNIASDKTRAAAKEELYYRDNPEKRPKLQYQERQHNKNSHVYLIESEHGMHKIGLTSDLNSRMKALKSSFPFDVKLICAIKSDDIYKLEKSLHAKFSHNKNKKGKEWFHLSEQEIEEIKSLATGY